MRFMPQKAEECMVIRWQSHTKPKGVGQYIHHKMEKAKK